jgi:hypothetical protein
VGTGRQQHGEPQNAGNEITTGSLDEAHPFNKNQLVGLCHAISNIPGPKLPDLNIGLSKLILILSHNRRGTLFLGNNPSKIIDG